MKTLLVALALVAVCAAGSDMDAMNKFNNDIMGKCMGKLNMDGNKLKELIDQMKSTEKAPRDYGCFKSCFLKEAGWINDDRSFDKEGSIKKLDGLLNGNTEIRDNMINNMGGCIDSLKGNTYNDDCDFGMDFGTCMYPKIKQFL